MKKHKGRPAKRTKLELQRAQTANQLIRKVRKKVVFAYAGAISHGV